MSTFSRFCSFAVRAALLVVLGNLIFELWWKHGRRKCLFSACVAAGAVLACVPWTWRNYTALHGFFFIHSNFGLELRIANHPGADADIEVTYARDRTLRHPSENLEEARQVRDTQYFAAKLWARIRFFCTPIPYCRAD